MKLIHEKIDLNTNKEYVLERHCRINYECDTSSQRKTPYEVYRKQWFEMNNQVNEFLQALSLSMKDTRTIAEIIKDEKEQIIAYLWVRFYQNKESGFAFVEIQEIYVESEFRNKGIATQLIKYVEMKAKENGAQVIRIGTGYENINSMNLYKKLGYLEYRVEFEKTL